MKFIIKFIKVFIIIFTILTLTTCSSYKPILDPNEKYIQAGKQQADQDIKQCSNDAETYLKEYKKRRMAKEAGRKAVIGAVVGGVTGLVFGNNFRGIIASSAIGTGVGATAGALGVAGEDKTHPDYIKQNYISNCLAHKGYRIIGWE